MRWSVPGCLVAVSLLGCSSQTGVSASGTSGGTGGTGTGSTAGPSTDATGGSGSDTSTTGMDEPPPEDPNYPRPDAGETCAAGFRSFSFTGVGSVCLPECGAGCPAGATGSVVGQCVINPDSSGYSCANDADCASPDESCVEDATGSRCLLPPSHCVLICDDGVTPLACPDPMVCTNVGVCEYAP